MDGNNKLVMQLKLTNNSFRNQYKIGSTVIAIILAIIAFILIKNQSKENYLLFFISAIAGTLFLHILSLPLYLKYKSINKDLIVEIFENKVKVIKFGIETIYSKSDIKYILYVRPASLDPPVFTRSSLEYFHFMKLYFKNGEICTITSLLKSDLTEVVALFPDNRIVRVRGIARLGKNYEKFINEEIPPWER